MFSKIVSKIKRYYEQKARDDGFLWASKEYEKTGSVLSIHEYVDYSDLIGEHTSFDDGALDFVRLLSNNK